jgi:hypothetical protein
MITIFCTVVLSVIQGVALNTGVLLFSKGRALQLGKKCAPVGVVVVVAGNLPGRSLANRPETTPAHKWQALAPEGQSRQGM